LFGFLACQWIWHPFYPLVAGARREVIPGQQKVLFDCLGPDFWAVNPVEEPCHRLALSQQVLDIIPEECLFDEFSVAPVHQAFLQKMLEFLFQ
jgi:hypothetical protein